MTAADHRISTCRACGDPLDLSFCDLGITVIANSYLPANADLAHEPRHPLHARVCRSCRLVQLDTTVDAADIFSDYAYFSSMSASWVAHAQEFCEIAVRRFSLGARSWVIEVASNDGYLLQHLVAGNIDCLGIEPAANVAAAARLAGVPTTTAFLTPDFARTLIAERGRAADLVIANNVIAHVPEITAFAQALAILVGETGIVAIECPHLLRLIDGVQLDTIYHEHYFYWSLYALERLLAGAGLAVFDIERLPTHGGSLRVYAAKAQVETSIVAEIRREEAERGILNDALYASFQAETVRVLGEFCAWLDKNLAAGQRIAGYGAAAKGNTLLNAANVTAGKILAVADRAAAKQGRLLPGSHIPVISPEAMLEMKPDIVLILPWNIRAEVATWLREQGFSGEIWTAIPVMEQWT